MGPYRAHVALAVALSIASALLALAGPGILKDITDTVADGIASGGRIDLGSVGEASLILAAVYVASLALGFGEKYIISSASQTVSGMVRRDLSRKLDRIPLSYYDGTSAGDIMSRLTNDADTIAHSSGQCIAQMVSSTVMMTGALAFMLLASPVLAAVTVVPAAAGFLLMYALVKRSQGHFAAQSRNLGRMQGHVDEMYSGHDIVRAYNGEEGAERAFGEINDDLYVSAYKSRFVSSLMPQIMNFVGNLGYALVCIVGAMLMIDGAAGVTYGVIVAFIVYARQFASPLTDISESVAQMQSVAAAADRVFGFLAAEEMEDEEGRSVAPSDVKGRVEFRDVHFSYLPGREVIRGFSAVVEPGQRVAIVGPTGAGKTTLVNLLMRFYEVDAGDILVDGVSIRSMRRADVHDLFTMVLQDAWVFDGTVEENVAYAEEGVSGDDVRRACEAVGIDGYVSSLEGGYGARLGGGRAMSAGQRQQIAIARAMVRKAPMLILDEATSSVDTRTERRIQEAMGELMASRTSFVIAHRLSTIRDSDLILVVREGSIVEQGTHGELLAAGGFYSMLYDSQFEGCDREGGVGPRTRW